MSDLEAERVAALVDQMPTYTEAQGCANCMRIFRIGTECPFCGSHSIENIGALLSGRNETDAPVQNGPGDTKQEE